jgi:hypothetical protein
MFAPRRMRAATSAATRATRTHSGRRRGLRRARTWVGVLAALIVLGGVGAPATGAAVATAQPLLAGRSATPIDAGEPESPLERDDLPPEGVAALFGFAVPAVGICTQADAKLRPDEVAWIGVKEVAESFFVCLEGFAPNLEIQVQALSHDDVVQSSHFPASPLGSGSWGLTIPPGDPRGVYVITAVQGPRRATGILWVEAASQPRIAVLPRTGPPGTEFSIALAGFPPGQSVRLYLYRRTSGPACNPFPGLCWKYATELKAPWIDESREALIHLRTRPDDVANSYRVMTDPAIGSVEFHVSPGGN